MIVVVVEVSRKAYLASVVPVIVNAVLNEHQIVVDIVAFVGKGDFPRSRLGEKQRAKILASWVSRKMRTIAQFNIKDPDAAAMSMGPVSGDSIPENPAATNRASLGSARSSGGINLGGHGAIPGANTSSLRNVETAPRILEQRELEQQLDHPSTFGAVEMPTEVQSPRLPDLDETPTKARPGSGAAPQSQDSYGLPDFARFNLRDEEESDGAPPPVGPKPPRSAGSGAQYQQHRPPQIRLPGVDGRESLDDWDREPVSAGGAGGVSGRRQSQPGKPGGGDDDDWEKDVNMYMNLAGAQP